MSEAKAEKAEKADPAEEFISGEAALNKPGDPTWPDSVPVQSRFGEPGDFVPAQSINPLTEAELGLDAPVDDEPEGAQASSEEEDEVAPYEEWTKAELSAEIGERNKDRDDESRMPLSGTKDELVARLSEDDASV